MNFTKFKLLMWKNVRLRRYHWIVTLIEFLLPISVAYLLTSVISSPSISVTSNKKATIFPAMRRAEFKDSLKSITLYYSPSNRAVDGFMNQIKSNFELVTGFANEAELETALQKKSNERPLPIGIVFKNIVSQDTLPNKLSYVLRNSRNWDTRNLYPERDTRPGPFYQMEYFNEYFGDIQLILNENFVKIKTKRNEFPQLEFEWFPYPEYTLDSSPRVIISLVVGMFVILAILILSIPLINDIIEEKDSGVKELMKISGLDEWMVWFGWFVHALVVSIISFPIVTWILTHPFKGPGSEALHFVQYSVFLVFIILYSIANVPFCFMFSSIFHKAGIASSIFLICFSLLFAGIGYLATHDINKLFLKLFTITPLGAFILGFGNIQYHEIQGIEYTWSSIGYTQDGRTSLLFCMGMLVLDTFVYLFLTFCITSINPGKFGVPKSPFFIFQRLFSCWKKDDAPLHLRNLAKTTDDQFFESSPSNLEATIRIKNLHKQFGSVYAVNGVNLNVYRGELTALLGHNGAGKTTTMSIMTGLTSPSSGSIYFRAMDIFQNMEAFRRQLGMCPQENRTMPYLSVMDHLLFFGQLKGVSLQQARLEAKEYLTMMEMESKKNSLAKELSGGMKRKLCLSIALMGKAQVLILDEPTSGMDVQSRRKIWDLLLDMRGKRTIIFTTHYMEEADALGDRIAIMNHGQIVCHGTPIFLKKAYGTGYELTITKNYDGDRQDIDEIIENVLPSAVVEFESPTEVVYKLPLTETDKFPIMFRNLESGMAQLGIKDMGIAATTMEQVFLKVGGISSNDAKFSRNGSSALTNGEYKHVNYTKGLSLVIQQLLTLFKKKFLFNLRNPFTIFIRIIIPTLVGLFLMSLLLSPTDVDHSPEPSLDLSLTTYPGSTVVIRNNGDTSAFEKHFSEYIAEKGGTLMKSEKPKIEDELLEQAKDIYKYNKNYIFAFELSKTTVKILDNPRLIHSLPIAITAYYNVLLRSISGNNLYQIETFNHPLPKSQMDNNAESCTSPDDLGWLAFYCVWFVAAAFYTIDLTSYFSTFVNMERIDGFYHIQMMSNVSPFLYWMSTLMFDFASFFLIVIIRVGIYKIIDHSKFLGLDTSLGVLALILVLYGISVLLFTNTIGYLSSSKEGSYTLLFIFNLICGFVVSNFYAIEKYKLYKHYPDFFVMLFYVCKTVILFVPSLNFSLLFIKLLAIFNWNSMCQSCSGVLKSQCEAKFAQKSYLQFPTDENPDGLLLGMTFLLIDIVLYAVILSLINMGYIRYWFDALKNLIFGTETTNSDEGDQDVQLEYHKVQQCKNDTSRGNRIALLVDGLRKNYLNWFKPFTAVSDVNFVVEPRECFGLLGVNGAGKSTTFKMLTAEILPTLGDSSIEGIKLSSNKIRYLSMAGYCPQTNCFIEVLTGKEMLAMIAAMRGVHRSEKQNLVTRWITIMGLEEFQNQRCGTYSGGNKRKLCTAMSLIGDPRVVFLDEPTSGVDPVSRRSLYEVMGRSKEAGQAVILTSHSMEECETLCDRITIMVAGVMKCIGTAQHLKKRYAQGFSVLVKLNDIPDFENNVSMLKENMAQTFTERDCILKDEHRGLLYYQIKDTTLQWSALFEKMEAIKYIHRGLVEDYVLADTTLEEVFMSFAKESAAGI